MNNITYLDISFGNIMNLILGITLGFFVMIILTCAIISKKFTKKNENIEIRKISNISYNFVFGYLWYIRDLFFYFWKRPCQILFYIPR